MRSKGVQAKSQRRQSGFFKSMPGLANCISIKANSDHVKPIEAAAMRGTTWLVISLQAACHEPGRCGLGRYEKPYAPGRQHRLAWPPHWDYWYRNDANSTPL